MKKFKRYRVSQLVFFVLSWIFAFLIIGIYEHSYILDLHYFKYISSIPDYLFRSLVFSGLLTGFIAGLTIGLLEVYIFRNRFNKIHFVKRLLVKLCIYLPLILVLDIALGFFTSFMNNPEFAYIESDQLEIYHYVTSRYFWMQAFVMAFLILLSISIFQLQYWFNADHFANFLFGKYRHGKEEERAILFMDMDDSTTIAEKLGHTLFFEFLNECFRDITKAILDYEGKIIDYIGDEVVISWPVKNANFLIEFYFGFNRYFISKKEYYINKYDISPVFKAGGHVGKVTIGEIGTEVKDIIYAGDVMNTTSRIQGLCKSYKKSFLISKDLVETVDLNEHYSMKSIDEIVLKGKKRSTTIFSVETANEI